MCYVLTWFVKPLSRSQLNYHNTVELKVISQRVGKNFTCEGPVSDGFQVGNGFRSFVSPHH